MPEIVSGNNRIRFDRIIHKNEDEIISGVKTISNLVTDYNGNLNVTRFSIKHPFAIKGTIPSNYCYSQILFLDSTDNPEDNEQQPILNSRLGFVECTQSTTGAASIAIAAYKPSNLPADGGAVAKLQIGYNSDGEIVSYAPTPKTIDNSTQIATTAFVKAQGYITSSESITGNAANVTGTVAITNGGTGATTRLNALKALTNEDVSTNAQYFLTITSSWGKGGYTSVANAKTVLGLKSAAYTESSAYAAASHTHSYLPLSGGEVTGAITSTSAFVIKHTGVVKGTNPSAWTCKDITIRDNSSNTGDVPVLGRIRTAIGTNGDVYTQMWAAKFDTGANSAASITIYNPKSGDAYATCPTPTNASSNTNVIATTAWVQTFCNTTKKYLTAVSITNSGSGNAVTSITASAGALTVTKGSTFLTSHQSLSNYCTLNSAQTITGSKIFINSVGLKNSSMGVNVNPTDNQYINFYCYDKDNNGVARILLYHNGSGGTRGYAMYIAKKASSTDYLRIVGGSLTPSDNKYYVDIGATGCTAFRPNVAGVTLGANATSTRWGQIYSSATSISTSDERMKTEIHDVPDDILDIWKDINWVQFKMKDSVKEKGEEARIHNGVIAQQIDNTFKKHNIDISKYSLFCYDEWDEEEAIYDENGNELKPKVEAGNLYSVRYEEALCMEAAYTRREIQQLENRIKTLEEENESLKKRLEILEQAILNK